MPTGYTYKVKEGKASFNEFVLDCAKAIGYLVVMRDEPSDAPIPDEFKPSSYHPEELANARKELRRAKSMTLEQAEREAERKYRSQITEFRKDKKENVQTRKNYESMLERVRNWQPPTRNHIGLRKFMASQLEESIKYDCGRDYYNEPPKKQTGEEYKASLLESAQRNVAYHQAEYRKEVNREKKRTEWVKALRRSLSKK